MTVGEIRDCDDQLEQIELEKARLEEAVEDDQQDIAEALDELREQLTTMKKDKLSQLQLVEQAERTLSIDLGVSLPTENKASAESNSFVNDVDVIKRSTGSRGGGVGVEMHAFMQSISALWKKLDASSIEKLNVGQQEALGVKDLLKLSNEQID